MNIDFHYGVAYLVARTAGLDVVQATTVAHSCQYVDDATTTGLLFFSGGETYERFASAHTMYDYHNTESQLNRLVWTPFHFLPAGSGTTLEEKAICRPDSDIAREVVRRAIRGAGAQNALHRLGVTLHTYVDTWAHQGFSGIESDFNKVRSLEAEDCTSTDWRARLANATEHLAEEVESDVLTRFFPLGHGAALHYPDQPWAKWSYVNGKGQTVSRDNLPDFIAAADMACRAVRGFLAKDEAFEGLQGLPEPVKEALRQQLSGNRSDDPVVRLQALSDSASLGVIPGLEEAIPTYIDKGIGSWKYVATGIESNDDGAERPAYNPAFEQSDYRHFHDAVKEHRFVVTQEILPGHGLRIA
ncbi:DUF6765 family protein [Paraburkholderia dinghuensis]|uniref:Uncharacterized protein n=1 Tax=Paraburkholderia dinghuensis TaxID=2305225 RepID=A0A3N6M8T7_9BURK|nr:DUF6765 family protein [Paraburkholderia dinghuensis]RQH00134.1 hypothetical protein D1Y85_25565 [Paraburkholderia dinghuensis]